MVAFGQEGAGINRRTDVVVIGGGLAGLAAAVALAGEGLKVDLFERSRYLGGRAGSVPHARLGMPVDRGQHILLGCCTNLLDFYHRVGALDKIHFPDSITFAGDGRRSILRSSPLPEPLHILPSLAFLKQLGLGDKARAVRLLFAALKTIEPDISTSAWLLSAGQSKTAVRSFWEPILIGALNEKLDDASARYAAMVIRQSMMLNREGFKIGVPSVPLGEINGDLPSRMLTDCGSEVHLRRTVTRISSNGTQVTVETADGESIEARYAVVACNPGSPQIVPPEVCRTFGTNPPELKPVQVSIVTLYFWYSGQIQLPEVLCISGGHFHWCFNRSAFTPQLPNMSTALSMVASAAGSLAGMPDEEICRAALTELRQSFDRNLPDPDKWAVIRCRNATFSPTPGCDDIRPLQRTSYPNTFLAGDWTNTGWPGTMESAVRSGYICAREILSMEGRRCPLPLPDLPTRGLAKLAGGADPRYVAASADPSESRITAK